MHKSDSANFCLFFHDIKFYLWYWRRNKIGILLNQLIESTKKLSKSWYHRDKDHRLPESNSACSIASSAVFNQQGVLPGIGMDGSFTYVKKVFLETFWKQGRDADVAVASARDRLVIRLRAAITSRPTLSSNPLLYTCSIDWFAVCAEKNLSLCGEPDRYPTIPPLRACHSNCQLSVSDRAAWT